MLLSPVKKIDSLYFVKPKGNRAFRVEKMVIVDGMIVAKLPAGGVYTNWQQVHSFALMPGDWGGNSFKLLKGLVALGIIDQKHLDEHMGRVKAHQDFDQRKYDRDQLEELNKRYGTNLSIPDLDTPEPTHETLTITDLQRMAQIRENMEVTIHLLETGSLLSAPRGEDESKR